MSRDTRHDPLRKGSSSGRAGLQSPNARRLSVRARLWSSLAILAASTLLVGTISWFSLRQATERLDQFHSETLSAVDRAITLSRRASDLATNAPWLLTLESPYRIAQEAEAAHKIIDEILASLPAEDATRRGELIIMRQAVDDLLAAATARSQTTDQLLRLTAKLGSADRRFNALAGSGRVTLPETQDWIALRRLTSTLIGAIRAEGLVATGEFQRAYHQQVKLIEQSISTVILADLSALRALAEGPEGLFELRRIESSRRIEAEAALRRIRLGAASLADHAASVSRYAQDQISAERSRTTSAIAFAEGLIITFAIVSLFVALLTALFVSRYVTANLRAISDAMTRLAVGDRTSRLPRGEHSGDEIGKLFHAFRAFRANTLRLDRSYRQLAQRNALFQNLYDGMSDGLAVLSDKGRLIGNNSRLAEVLALDAALVLPHASMDELLQKAGWRRVSTALKAPGFTELHHPDGKVLELRESKLSTGGSVMLLSDVSERRELANRLAMVQRTDALGKIAGEVAHDFGNILATITTSLHLQETAPPERIAALRQSMASTLELGASLTQRLLAFARRLHLEPEVMDLNALAAGVEDLIGLAIDPDIALEIRLAPVPLRVRIDPGQMESALLNLCLNAAQAITGEGKIIIALSATQDGRAEIRVSDNGAGMAPEVLAHATEPFFTARKDGSGTGLGLATVYGFIRQSGGDLRISSQLGYGTTVSLFLPLNPTEPKGLPSYGRVLVVEDNPDDATWAKGLLSASDVTLISNDKEALSVLQYEHTFDIILTDLHFGVTPAGWAIAEAALNANKRCIAIVLSGRLPAEDPLKHHFPDRAFRLEKPLDPTALTAILQGRKPNDFSA